MARAVRLRWGGGKTYLIREHFHNQFFFYHTGLRSGSLKSQLTAFRASLVKYGHETCPVLKNWLEAFSELNKLVETGKPGRKIIFIDELPWMDTAKSGLVTGLEYFWNALAFARSERDIFLIVCGSASSWIVKNLLKNTEDLFGISWLQVTAYAWRGEHAQIDLLLNRSDKTIDICEIKYAETPYEIDKVEHERLLARKTALQSSIPLRRRYRLVMITFAGLKHNKYWNDVQGELALDDLFAP